MLSVRDSQQKYKDLYGNPYKRPEKMILRKNPKLKNLTLLPLWVASFPCVSFQIGRELSHYQFLGCQRS